MVDIRGWTPADRFGAATFGLFFFTAVAGGVGYMRSDYQAVNQQVTEAAKQEVARLNSQMIDLRNEMKQRDDNTQTLLKQRDDNIQIQFRDLTLKLDQRPGPETVNEIRRRQTENEGKINLLLNQLSALQTSQATLEVRLQSVEKGRDIALPGHR